MAGGFRTRHRKVLPVLDHRAAPHSLQRTLPLLRSRRRARSRSAFRRKGRPGPHPLRSDQRVLPNAQGCGLRCGRIFRREARRSYHAVLQRRSLHARIRIRSIGPVRQVQRRHYPLQSGVPELAAVPDGIANRGDSPHPGSSGGRRHLGEASPGSRRANQPTDVGRAEPGSISITNSFIITCAIIRSSLLFIHCGPASRPRSRPRRWFAISECSSGRVASKPAPTPAATNGTRPSGGRRSR